MILGKQIFMVFSQSLRYPRLNFSAHTNAINSLTTQNVINAVLNLPQTLNNLQNLSDLTKNINSNSETKLDDFSDIVSEKKIKTGMYKIGVRHQQTRFHSD